MPEVVWLPLLILRTNKQSVLADLALCFTPRLCLLSSKDQAEMDPADMEDVEEVEEEETGEDENSKGKSLCKISTVQIYDSVIASSVSVVVNDMS